MNKLIPALLTLALTGGACISQKRQDRSASRTELGTAYLTENNDELAIQTLREAIEINRRNPEAWHMLAMAYMRKGAYEESERAFKKALRFAGTDAAILNNYSYLLLKLDRPEEAIGRLEEARGDLLYRKPAITLNSLGYAYILTEQCDEARAVLEEAVTRAPNYCQAWFHLGVANRCLGRPEMALEALDRVILTCPDQAAGSWLQICELEKERGRTAEAIDACRELLAIPDLPLDVSADARRLLAELDGER